MKEIKRIFCPYCKSEMVLKQEFKFSKGEKLKVGEAWHCTNKECVHFFQAKWFQRFNHFDKFLILKGQDELQRLKEINLIKLEEI